VIAAGHIWGHDDVNALLAQGADGLALGRAAILNPSWPREIQEPGYEPRRAPTTLADLAAADVSPGFAQYLSGWPGFVAP
jgi:2,4-dienoyl-CoA reductase-like NADH-dependent reductase (Old Yellow Enzyme family)